MINKIDKALARERGNIIPEETNETESGEDTTQEAAEQQPSQDKAIGVSELFGDEGIETETETEKTTTDTSLIVDENVFKENPFLALLRDLRQYGKEVSVPVENVKAVDRILGREDIQKLIPPDAEFRWSSETIRVGDREYRELFLVKKDAELTGKYLTDAKGYPLHPLQIFFPPPHIQFFPLKLDEFLLPCVYTIEMLPPLPILL